MILLIRRFLAVVSACGLAAAIIAYVGSLAGTTKDAMFRWAILAPHRRIRTPTADVRGRIFLHQELKILLVLDENL